MRSKDNLVVVARTILLTAVVSVVFAALAVTVSYGVSSQFAPGLVPQFTVGLAYPLFLVGLLFLAYRAV